MAVKDRIINLIFDISDPGWVFGFVPISGYFSSEIQTNSDGCLDFWRNIINYVIFDIVVAIVLGGIIYFDIWYLFFWPVIIY